MSGHMEGRLDVEIVRHALRHATLPADEWLLVEAAWSDLLTDINAEHQPIRTDEPDPDDHEIGI